MGSLAAIALFVLAALALWGKRWAYGAFVALALLWIPARTGFALEWPACTVAPTRDEIIAAFGNGPHIVLFALFYVLTAVQLRGPYPRRLGRAALLSLVFGVLVELQQGATGTGSCELRDLIPDTVGILLGAAVMARWYTWKREGPA